MPDQLFACAAKIKSVIVLLPHQRYVRCLQIWDLSMKLKVEGATINFEVDGPKTAPAVLLWHGAGCTLRMWDLVVARMPDRFRMIRFDVRGTGRSSVTDDPRAQYTLEQYADDANRLLDECGADKTHVWSMAWGSRAALAYCSLNADRVISAALYDASIGEADVKAQREGSRKALDRQLAAGTDRFPMPEGWNSHDSPEDVPQALSAAAKFNLPGAVPRLTMPLLVATGDHDPNLASSRAMPPCGPAGLMSTTTSRGSNKPPVIAPSRIKIRFTGLAGDATAAVFSG